MKILQGAEPGWVHIQRDCPWCGQTQEVVVKENDWRNWQLKVINVQEAFPYLNDSGRELLQTGICDKCWDKMLKEK